MAESNEIIGTSGSSVLFLIRKSLERVDQFSETLDPVTSTEEKPLTA